MKYIVVVAIVVMIAVLACVALASESPAPLFLSNKALGGARLNDYTPGVAGGIGPNNIGLLIRASGIVTYIDTTNKFFYIDDGANCVDGTRRPAPDNSLIFGVRVSYGGLATDVPNITPYPVNSHVVVTGIISTCVVPPPPTTGGLVRPNVRLRRSADLVLFP